MRLIKITLFLWIACLCASLHTEDVKTINRHFSNNLYRILSAKEPNLLISPFSIENSLFMLYMGSSTLNEYEMRHFFMLKNSKETLPQEAFDIRKELETRLKNLLVMNQTLWIHTPHKINPDYSMLIKNHFGGEIETCDLAKADHFIPRVEEWISQKSKKKIPKFLHHYAHRPTTRAIMTDIATLKSLWTHPFPLSSSSQESFFPSSDLLSKQVSQAYMSQVGEFDYYENPRWKLLSLPLENDLSFVALLPKDPHLSLYDESFLEQIIDCSLLKKMKRSCVFVQIPKFASSKRMRLNQPLMSLGLIRLFTQEADLSKICEKSSLYICDFLHQSVLSINEWGIDGSASFFSLTPKSRQQNKMDVQHQFIANHPFLYLIIDMKQRIILFLGTYTHPTQSTKEGIH